MRAVNLLPKDAERARRTTPDPALLIGVAGLAIVLAALFSMYLNSSQKVQNGKNDRAARQQSYDVLTKNNPPPKVLPVQQQVASLEGARIGAVSNALSFRVPWSNIFGQIALVMPSGVKLSTLAATTPTSANPAFPATTGGKLDITGWAYSQESVVLLQTRLRILPPLSSVTINSITINAAGSPVTWNFSMTAQLRAPGATSAAAPAATLGATP